jgi:hypothetical protein
MARGPGVRRWPAFRRIGPARLAALASPLLACEPATERVENGVAPIHAEGRAEQVRRPVLIEGMADTLDFRLVRAPGDFALHFSTYVPEDMAVDFTTISERQSVHFTASFGGVVEERARVSLTAYPPGTTLDHARAEVAAYLSGLVPDDHPLLRDEPYEQAAPVWAGDRYGWAAEQATFRVPRPDGPGILVGRAGIAVHGERIFDFIIEYPEEYGDGMEPRIHAILEEWRWEDTGEMLMPRR